MYKWRHTKTYHIKTKKDIKIHVKNLETFEKYSNIYSIIKEIQ